MAASKAARTPADRVEAAASAVEALGACLQELKASSRQPGFDPGAILNTSMGNLTPSLLERQCNQERERWVKSQPRLRWLAAVEEMSVRLGEVHGQAQEARTTTDTAAAVEGWKGAIEGFESCRQDVKHLARQPAADRNHTLKTPFGKKNLSNLDKECTKRKQNATDSHKKAVKAHALVLFVEECKGDEVAIAKREGIPTRIETFHGGRVFVYDKARGRRKKTLRFGFDKSGQRKDFTVDFRGQLSSIVTELARVLKDIEKAKTGGQRLPAVEASFVVLDVCQEVIDTALAQPGAQADQTFETPLGKLTAAKLQKSCGQERKRLDGSLPGLKWQVRVEELLSEVAKTKERVDKSKTATRADDKLDLLDRSGPGYKECATRAKSLGKEPEADRRLEFPTAFGKHTTAGLAKACTQQLAVVKTAVAEAKQLKKLEEFVSTCKGDEIAVAKRDGIPNKVDDVEGGRVFVYKKKRGKPQRIAFDTQGKKTTEKALKAAAKARAKAAAAAARADKAAAKGKAGKGKKKKGKKKKRK